ncbi:hypothetical protein BT93_G0071 [Corymbia citriodora subsp. variegata]|nr:hypothetical protein BT93_G0071 [Corymbia citriodora subsp. variegata]
MTRTAGGSRLLSTAVPISAAEESSSSCDSGREPGRTRVSVSGQRIKWGCCGRSMQGEITVSSGTARANRIAAC